MSRSVAMDYESLRERQARVQECLAPRMGGMAAFQDALGDYYDSGAIGDPPRREDFDAPEQELADEFDRNDHQ